MWSMFAGAMILFLGILVGAFVVLITLAGSGAFSNKDD